MPEVLRSLGRRRVVGINIVAVVIASMSRVIWHVSSSLVESV